MRSWPFALVVRARPTYIVVGVVAGALHFGLCILAQSILELETSGKNIDGSSWHYRSSPGWEQPILFSLEMAYLIVTAHFVLRGARDDCIALQSVVGSQAATKTREDLVRVPGLAWVVMPLLGIGFWATHLTVMGELAELLSWYSRMPGYPLWVQIDVFLFEVGVTFLIFCFVRTAWLFYRLGLRIDDINPLDVRPLQPFSRSGPRMALCLAGSLALALPFVGLDAQFFVVPLVTMVVTSLALFLLPLVRVRRRIVRAREEALDRLGRALAGDGEALVGTRFAGAQDLADLVVLRQAVEEAPTWPVSESGWWRFVTYTLLPLFSWAASEAIGQIFA
jgi:hypothetical protein